MGTEGERKLRESVMLTGLDNDNDDNDPFVYLFAAVRSYKLVCFYLMKPIRPDISSQLRGKSFFLLGAFRIKILMFLTYI